jgi:hypothetical protein
MAKTDLKAEVVQMIQGFILANRFNQHLDSPAARYAHSIVLLLQKEPTDQKLLFFQKLSGLLDSKYFPLLKVESVLLLYNKWRRHPVIFDEIKLLQVKVKTKLDSPEFWKRFLLHNASDKAAPNFQKARIQLLICVLNEVNLTTDQLEKYGIVFEALLKLNVQAQHHAALSHYLKKEPTHVFHTMTHVIKRSIALNVAPFDVSVIISRHFFQLDSNMAWFDGAAGFFQVLEDKLPSNYLTLLLRRFVGKIMVVYRANATLFEGLPTYDAQALNENSLLQALFANFMISGSLVRNYFRDTLNEREFDWFLAELKGTSFLNSSTLPLTLTKKAAHQFRILPYEFDLSVTKSLVFSGIETQINDYNFAYTVAAALRDDLNLDFWVQTMVFLHKKGLEANHVMEMMDFIQHKIFVEQEEIDFKKRSLGRLVNEMQAWHAELRQTSVFNKDHPYNTLAKAEIPHFQMEVAQQKFVIKQLLKAIDLFHEGRLLSHCVFSYRSRCFRGESFIFSLRRLEEDEQEAPLITIEIVNGEVFQARGKFNRNPTPEEQRIIRVWAVANQLNY